MPFLQAQLGEKGGKSALEPTFTIMIPDSRLPSGLFRQAGAVYYSVRLHGVERL